MGEKKASALHAGHERSGLRMVPVFCALVLAVALAATLHGPVRAFAAPGDWVQAANAAQLEAASPQRALAGQADAGAYTVPVSMLKLDADEASMASPVMHPVAYAQEVEGGYRVSVYFVNAPIMGSTIYAGSLGAATYDKNGDGTMVAADSDVYDKATQVKTVVLSTASLDTALVFHLDMFMANVRLVFDTAQMAPAESAPEFPVIDSSVTKFPADSVAVIGGSGADGANALAALPNGQIVIAGDTASTDQSFAGHASATAQAYVCVCSPEGEVLGTTYLTGPKRVSVFDVSACDDSAFFSCGYFQSDEGDDLGDFAGLAMEGAEGTRNAFVAKHGANGKVQWVRAISSSQACQYDGVAATSDGGCIAVAEVLKGANYTGTYADELKSVVNTVVVKYGPAGEEEWHAVVTGGSVVDTDGAVAETPRGTYLMAGSYTVAPEGTLLGSLGRFGGESNTFDLYVLEFDAAGAVIASHSYGGSAANETMGSILPTDDGGFIATGSTQSSDGVFSASPIGAKAANGYALKCNADGSVAWVDTHKATQATEALYVAETPAGYAVLGGGQGKDLDFTQQAKGQQDVYVALYDKAGHRTLLRTFGGSKNDYAAGMAVTASGGYVFFAQSDSSDVDLEGLARGGSDAVLVWSSKKDEGDVQRAFDAESAAAVEGLINALPAPDDVSESDEPAIATARAEFDALNAEATALVPAGCVAKLQAVEAALAQLKADRQAASRFEAVLNALPETPGASDAQAVAAVRAAYDALSDSQKALVSAGAFRKLQNAESCVKAAQAAQDEQAARDGQDADSKARKVKSVTVNVATVNAKAVKAAIAKKGGKPGYVTKVTIGAKAKTISSGAFAGMAKLAQVTVGKNVKTIKAGAFKKAGSLKTVVVQTKKLKKASVKGSLKGSSVQTVKVPKAKRAAYKAMFAKANSGKKVRVK